jgi:hypothetical protein
MLSCYTWVMVVLMNNNYENTCLNSTKNEGLILVKPKREEGKDLSLHKD